MTPAFHKSQPAIVSVLGITQTLAWASTYYLPAVLADPVCRSLHISDSWFFAISQAHCCFRACSPPWRAG